VIPFNLGSADADNGPHEIPDVAEPSLEYLVNLAIVYFIIHVDNTIPKSSHRSVHRQGIGWQQPGLTNNLK
jgi:hypothetical protein